MNSQSNTYPDLCICCGEPVPEGRMVCYACESGRVKPNLCNPAQLAEYIEKNSADTKGEEK